MNNAKAGRPRNTIAAVLSLGISMVAVVFFCIFAVCASKPDGTTTVLDLVFIPQVIGVYLFFVLVGAALSAQLWRGSPGSIAVISAVPYSLLGLLGAPVLFAFALFTFAAQYAAVRSCGGASTTPVA